MDLWDDSKIDKSYNEHEHEHESKDASDESQMCEDHDYVIVGDFKVWTHEKILEETCEPVEDYLPPTVITSRWLPGWKVSGLHPRKLFRDRGETLNQRHNTYRETKQITKALGKKARKRAEAAQYTEISVFRDKRFTRWQSNLAELIHQGHHVILDIATSCGKTWATSMIVTHETLSDDNATCIFVSPNPEILRDNVSEIRTNNYKYYITSGKRMIDTQSRSYCTYDGRSSPTCQIMCLTADNFVGFVTNELNHGFISKLKYIVFDEVHLPEVSKTMWWSSLLPQSAQFILLSATLGNPSESVDLLEKIAPTHPIKVIKYEIRPIPLQRVMFKGCDYPKDGFRCATLKGARRLSCQINQFDPTPRDMKSLDRSCPIPEDREAQYYAGQELVDTIGHDKIAEAIDRDLKEAVVDPTAENIHKILAYVFSNGMQPALVFHTSSVQTKRLCQQLIGYIQNLEKQDDSFRKAERAQSQLNKISKRTRDKKAEEDTKLEESGKKWSKPEETMEDEDEARLIQMTIALGKWKFPNQFGYIPTNIPQWVQDCLSYGIGVYMHSFPAWLRNKMFDAFKEGKLQVMIADPTISVGINLPVRTCIMCGDDMSPSLYKQMSGRAGRRGFDTQGYIIPMFDKALVRDCLLTKVPPVKINVPETLQYTELIRLLTPVELGNFYTPITSKDPEHPQPPGTGMVRKFKRSISEFTDSLTLKQSILDKFMELSDTDKCKVVEYQIQTIKDDHWHYHRLTNLIQCLQHNETMLLMQLLTRGDIQKIDASTLMDILAYTMIQRPAHEHDTSDFMDFRKHQPIIASKLDKYAAHFKIPFDRTTPSNYFIRFVNHGEYSISDLPLLEQMGEWIFELKRQIFAITPRDNWFRKLLVDVDERFMAASRRTGLM